MITYRCDKDQIETRTSRCPVCGKRAYVKASEVYWCGNCNIPLYGERCTLCGQQATRMTSDVRPVFPQERLLLEILLGKPFAFLKDSVWNGSGNRYYVDGERISFSIAGLRQMDAAKVRKQYLALCGQNVETYFQETAEKFVRANRGRLEEITSEAVDYIQSASAGYEAGDMFISFSGGKDSTVTASLVMRALGNCGILHIFGDTTLEFPETMDYITRYKRAHPKTPVVSSRNREKDFEELCRLIGPPSRVMRWCCTVFKTGAIQRKIKTLFRDKGRILTFYGIRRSESASRSKYDRQSDSPKITKQVTVSPIIDWLDFDVWLYLLGTGEDFNHAYRLGYARVGCFCCPNNSLWSEFLSRVHMPERAEAFRAMLVEFAAGIGKKDAEHYVDKGYWKARQGGNGVAYAGRGVVAFTPCALEENSFNYELLRLVEDGLYELFRPFGRLNFDMGNPRLGEVYVLNGREEPILRLQGRTGSRELKVTVFGAGLSGAVGVKAAEEKIRCQLTKYQMCMGCLACEGVCRHNAVSIREEQGRICYSVNDTRCLRCGECVGHFEGGCYMRKVLTVKRKKIQRLNKD